MAERIRKLMRIGTWVIVAGMITILMAEWVTEDELLTYRRQVVGLWCLFFGLYLYDLLAIVVSRDLIASTIVRTGITYFRTGDLDLDAKDLEVDRKLAVAMTTSCYVAGAVCLSFAISRTRSSRRGSSAASSLSGWVGTRMIDSASDRSTRLTPKMEATNKFYGVTCTSRTVNELTSTRDFIRFAIASVADARQVVRAGYDAVAHDYLAARDRSGSSADVVLLRDVLSDLPRGSRILDVGCGAGDPVGRVIADAGHELVGVDISETQLRLAHQRLPDAEFIRGDVVDLEFDDGAFDLITAYFAVFHVPRDLHRDLFASFSGG